MNSSTYPKTRGLPLSSPSPSELKRQRAKLAFYELPITTFDCPVENDPREVLLKRRQERLLASWEDKTKGKMTRPKKQSNAKREGFKSQFLTRLMRRLRSLCEASIRVARKNGAGKTPPHAGFSDDFHGALEPPAGVVLDESTRFRLQLAGLRVQGAQPTSPPLILTL